MGRLSQPVLTTDRLRLEPVTASHLDLFAELNADPQVMRFILGRGATREETEAEWVERLGVRSDIERGLGYWAGYVDGAFAGWWSASAFVDDPAVAGLGYRLCRSAWGQGLATEGASAMVDLAFAIVRVERVVASTMAANVSSRRVLEKLGMTHVDTYIGEWDDPLPGSELGEVVYELRRVRSR